MRRIFLGALTLAIIVAAPAMAKDRNGYTQIAAGDYSAAEQSLTAERRAFPDRPELMLNLAWVYRQTGRGEAARTMYNAVLDRRDVAMDLSNGRVASSHVLAKAGLARTADPQISAR